MPRRGPVILILAGALALTACSGDDDSASTADVETAALEPATAEATAEEMAEESASAAGGVGDQAATGDAVDAAEGRTPAQDGTTFDIGVVGRDVIIEMRVVLGTDDIQRAVASIMANASTLGGGVASSDVNYGTADGTGSEGYAVLVVKVPPDAVDRLLSGLGDTGTIQSINQSARDVTEQLVDLDVRIDNARQSVINVRTFMDRTENLNELVTLEAELTRRQTELEQLEAQQRDLTDRVALSTITIEVVPIPTTPVAEVADDTDDGIADAFRSGWDAFAALLFGIGFVVAAALPFVVSGLLVMLVIWLVVRRFDSRGSDRTRRHEPIEASNNEPEHEAEREPVA